jgi:hypothetical protein
VDLTEGNSILTGLVTCSTDVPLVSRINFPCACFILMHFGTTSSFHVFWWWRALRPLKTELFYMLHSCASWHDDFLGLISILTWMSSSLCSVIACFGHSFLSRTELISCCLLNNNAVETYLHISRRTFSVEDMSWQEICVPACT